MSEAFTEAVPHSVGTAAMRSMLPNDMLERFLDGPFNYEVLRVFDSARVGEKLVGQAPPPTPRQANPRDENRGNEVARESAPTRTRLSCATMYGSNGHPVRLCPCTNECQDVDGVGMEQPSDADKWRTKLGAVKSC